MCVGVGVGVGVGAGCMLGVGEGGMLSKSSIDIIQLSVTRQ